MSTFSKNPSEYEGELIKKNKDFRLLIEELLIFINRNGLDFDNEEYLQRLLIKTELQSHHEH
jgi:hypothetical protein